MTLKEAVESLEDTMESALQAIDKAGVQGTRHGAGSIVGRCLIARYLQVKTEDPGIKCGYNEANQYGEDDDTIIAIEKMPEAIGRLILLFERNMLPAKYYTDPTPEQLAKEAS